jgi:hypothetical protein
MTTVVRVSSTHTLPMEAVQGASWVGQVVTVGEHMFTVHSVEGRDWYAHLQDGQVTVDVNMTPVHIVEPIAMLLPMGAELGQGFGRECEVNRLTRGVCLTKW